MNKILPVITAVAFFAAMAPSYAQQKRTKDQLLGTWKLVSLKPTSGDKVSYPLGDHPEGYVTMTPDWIWLLSIDSTREVPATAALTDVEAVAMMKSHVSWTGKYSTDQTPEGIKITAHVDISSSQGITGKDRVCFMRVDGNKLMVTSPGVIVPMTSAKRIVEFDMVKAD